MSAKDAMKTKYFRKTGGVGGGGGLLGKSLLMFLAHLPG